MEESLEGEGKECEGKKGYLRADGNIVRDDSEVNSAPAIMKSTYRTPYIFDKEAAGSRDSNCTQAGPQTSIEASNRPSGDSQEATSLGSGVKYLAVLPKDWSLADWVGGGWRIAGYLKHSQQSSLLLHLAYKMTQPTCFRRSLSCMFREHI